MNQDAKPNMANNPVPPVVPSANPPATALSGLKSVLKIAIPLALMAGVVFGITYFSRYTPDDPSEEPGKGSGPAGGSQPLVFFSSEREWDPPNLRGQYRNFPLSAPSAHPRKSESPFEYNLQDRVFPGYFEPVQHPPRTALFWFENRHPNSVTMQLKVVTCSSCSGGVMTIIPPELTRDLLQRAAVSTLPMGMFNGLSLGTLEPAAKISVLPTTQQHTFLDTPNATYKVPGATNPDKWSPQWGILTLTFTVSEKDDTKVLEAGFATQVDGTQIGGMNVFKIGFHKAMPFEVSEPTIDAGRLDDLSGEREYTRILYSATRGPGSEFGDFEKPQVQPPAGGGDTDKFIEVTKIERIPDAELPELAAELSRRRPTRVQAAYRATIVVRPKVGDAKLDIGLLTRNINFTSGPGVQTVQVSATVRGTVWIEGDRSEITFDTFNGSQSTSRTVTLVTEKTGMELAVVVGECNPKYFNYQLEKQPDRGGQGYYRLRVTVPPGKHAGAIRDGVVVMEVKGPNPQRIRIPVTGFARFQ